MKKLLLCLCVTLMSTGFLRAQCVFTCSNYAVSPITFTSFPIGTSVTPTSFLPNADDGTLTPVPIGFNFQYYCNNYTQVVICTNGFIQLDYGTPPDFSSPVVHPTQTFPDPTPPNGIVALNMADLDPGVGGAICYGTFGTAPNRMFVVTYSNVPIFGLSSSLNFGQIVLYETSNHIEIHSNVLNPASSFLGAGTQGIENTTGTLGTTPPGRNNNSNWYSTAANTAYLFSPYTPQPPTAITGAGSSCQGIPNTYVATTMPGASSYSWAVPAAWTGTSNSSVITATAGASGNLSVTATYTCGTSAATTISVTVIPSPIVSITSATPNIFCSGATVTFVTNGALTYTLEPGTIIGTSPLFDTPMQNTTYTLSGTNSSGCISQNLATYNITVKETPTVTVNSGAICPGASFTLSPQGANTYTYSSIFNVITPPAGIHSYSVVGTSTNGCVSNSAISTVTVNALPTISVVPTRSAICNKETTSLTVSGALNYTWSVNNATTTVISVTPQINNFYSVTGVDANGCSNSGTITVKVNTCIGIEERENTDHLTVFPNPSTGIYNIKLSQVTQVTVFNMLGQQLFTELLQPGEQQIDLSSYPAGRYMITANNNNSKKHLVLIKQ